MDWTQEYFINMKKELQEIKSGIKNSVQGGPGNYTPGNNSHQNKLKKVFKKYIREAGDIGFYMVGKHANCGLPSHEDEYVREKIGGQEVVFQDPRFVWRDVGFSQCDEKTLCPCSNSHEERNHLVIYDIVFDQSADMETCETYYDIFRNLQFAIDRAIYKGSRSRIREAVSNTIACLSDH